MDPREALARIRDIHQPADMMGEVGCDVCNRDSDNWRCIQWPCETRRICDEVLDRVWTTGPLDGAGLLAGDTSKAKVSTSTTGFTD